MVIACEFSILSIGNVPKIVGIKKEAKPLE